MKELFSTKPDLDRRQIISAKGKPKPEVLKWFLDHPNYVSWRDADDTSRLLWVTGPTATGKTMLSVFLSQIHDRDSQRTGGRVSLFYFCAQNEDKRNTVSSALRGVIWSLLQSKPSLDRHLIGDFCLQGKTMYTDNGIEMLWGVFESMVQDPAAGEIYCVIDGLDECKSDSLRKLLRQVRNFFPEGSNDPPSDPKAQRVSRDLPSHTPTNAPVQVPGKLKMVLVSREEPPCLLEELSGYPRVQLGAGSERVRKPRVGLSSLLEQWEQRGLNSSQRSGLLVEEMGMDTNRPAVRRHRQSAPVHPSPAVPPLSTPNVDSDYRPSTGDHLNPIREPDFDTSASEAHLPTALTQDLEPAHDYFSQSPDTEPDLCTTAPPETLMADDGPLNNDASDSGPYDDTAGIHDESHTEKLPSYEESSYSDALATYAVAKAGELASDPKELDLITLALREYGDGTFLWMDLAADHIRRHAKAGLHTCLQQLPNGIDEMYCSALHRTPQHLVNLVRSILCWVVTAKRPLQMIELSVVLQLLDDSVYPPGISPLLVQAVEACSSFLQMDDEGKVYVVHTSAQELLTNQRSAKLHDAGLSHFHVSTKDMDSFIFRTCIDYLERGCLDAGPVDFRNNKSQGLAHHLDRYPFCHYATFYWQAHLQTAGPTSIDLYSPFFAHDSKIRKSWWHTQWMWVQRASALRAPRDFTLLHVAAYFDLVKLAQALHTHGELRRRLNSRDSHGSTPVEYAIRLGNLAMLKWLIGHGARFAPRPGFVTALDMACEVGHYDTVKYLLELGLDIDEPAPHASVKRLIGFAGRYAHGILEGYSEVNDRFRQAYRVSATCGKLSPIHRAAMYGHSEVMELLLHHDNSNEAGSKPTSTGWTSLHLAAMFGQLECCELLIPGMYNASPRNARGWTPVHCAASNGSWQAVQMLLQQGASVNALTEKRKTPLHLASFYRHAETVAFLIANGSILDVRSHKGETALHLAIRKGSPDVVEVLFVAGADLHITNNDGLTPRQTIKHNKMTASEIEILRVLDTCDLPGYEPVADRRERLSPAVQPQSDKINPQSTGESDFSANMQSHSDVQPNVKPYQYTSAYDDNLHRTHPEPIAAAITGHYRPSPSVASDSPPSYRNLPTYDTNMPYRHWKPLSTSSIDKISDEDSGEKLHEPCATRETTALPPPTPPRLPPRPGSTPSMELTESHHEAKRIPPALPPRRTTE